MKNKKPKTTNFKKASVSKKTEVHPWRVCPYGEHWVRTHPLHVPPSKKNPTGITTRHEHCAKNPSGRDQLYPDEIQEIAQQNFSKVKNKPCPLVLEFKKDGSSFDDFIAGWTQYWNDIFNPSEPLDSNMVKALIASESRFNPKTMADKKNSNSARGLMQITNETRKILGNEKGELKDHYLTLTKEDLNDPNINIAAGIRWLFNKKDWTSNKLKHEATWLETIYNYKGALKVSKKRGEEIMRRFNKFYEDYKKCGKK